MNLASFCLKEISITIVVYLGIFFCFLLRICIMSKFLFHFISTGMTGGEYGDHICVSCGSPPRLKSTLRQASEFSPIKQKY